jgi:hypothetical protein
MARHNGFLPPPPEVEGQELDIEYVSPVAKAQRAQEAESLIGLASQAEFIELADPGSARVLNGEETYRWLGDIHGTPQKIFRTREQMEELRRQQEQQAQAAMMLQAGESGSASLKNIAQANQAGAHAQQIRGQTAENSRLPGGVRDGART